MRTSGRWVVGVFTSVLLWPCLSLAQVTPAAGYTPPDDTPAIRIGMTLFTDYTYIKSPEVLDADGNSVHVSQFNVARAYLNVTGNISHVVAFRITPDISREVSTVPSLSGSLVYRIKYAFVQFNLDDWMARGSWTRLGIQQTPWVDFQEGIYRYRFQGTVFSEREGFLSSSDAGASFHYNLPSNFGDFHVGVYNGETYSRAEVNDQKAFQIRASVRPFSLGKPVLRGLRAHIFYDADSYVSHADRTRLVGSVTYEHAYLNAGAEYLGTTDQTSVRTLEADGQGYSIWATPKAHGWELLLRHDYLKPNTDIDAQRRTRTIVGVSYWFPHQGTVTTALLLDYDNATFENFLPAQPKQTRIAVHGLVNF